MNLVICDDDVTLRSVVSKLAESVGHTVIAETDSAGDAVELVTRFGAEALVLDLSLPWGSGMTALHELRARGSICQVVVFTAYGEETDEALDAGARAVVEKPDFEALEAVLAELAAGTPPPAAGVERERRKPPRERPLVPAPVVRSPSGLEEPESVDRVVEVLEPGDAVLYVHVAQPDVPALDPWGELVEVDRFLDAARTLRAVLRVQDRLTVEDGELVAVLLDAGRVGVESAWRRVERAYQRGGGTAVLSGGWAVHDDVAPPYATRARARDAAVRSVGQPAGDRLWAG